MKQERFTLDGLERSYLLYEPQTATGGPYPLVLALHGGGGSGQQFLQMTQQDWNRLADTHGFVVAYPDAVDGFWDFGGGFVSEIRAQNVDDLAFFNVLIDRIATTATIDQDRIFATGLSRGGHASYALACKIPGKIRAIAPVVMPLPAYLEPDCRNGPPVPIAILNGTADPIVPYDGGRVRVFGRTRGKVMSTDATVDLWTKRNGCTDTSVSQVIDPADDETVITKMAYEGCTGAPVVLYQIEGGGHTWPGGKPFAPKAVVGPISQDLNGAEEIWQFFAQF